MIGWDFDWDSSAEELEEDAFAIVFGLAVIDCEIAVEGTDDDLDGLAALDCAFWEADEAVLGFAAADGLDEAFVEAGWLIVSCHEDSEDVGCPSDWVPTVVG
jgi:hypothetical protein